MSSGEISVSTIWKVSLAVLPMIFLQLRRIALAGRLDDDPRRALLGYQGLLGAQGVDPLANDFDRAGDGVGRGRVRRLRHEGDDDSLVRRPGERDVAAARTQALAPRSYSDC